MNTLRDFYKKQFKECLLLGTLMSSTGLGLFFHFVDGIIPLIGICVGIIGVIIIFDSVKYFIKYKIYDN